MTYILRHKLNKPVNKKSPAAKAAEKRPIDIYLEKYSENHQNPTNKLIHWICIPFILFSLLGLTWAIPFPYIKLLGQYNGYFNWASFVLAFSIYYYYKFSPMFSYIMLLVAFALSYGIIEIDTLHKTGGPALWLVSVIIFVLGCVGEFVGHKIEGRRPSFLDDVKFLLIGPVWLLHFTMKRLNIKY
jgi:uncharacterized membrane protein YGL010W